LGRAAGERRSNLPGKNGLFAFGMVEEYAPLEDDDVTEDA